MNYRWFRMLAIAAIVSAGAATAQRSVATANAVLVREMPYIAGQIHLSLTQINYAEKTDGFRITGSRGEIHVQAATIPTLLFGVNWYLKYVAHLNVSTNGSQVGSPGLLLPAPRNPIERPAPYPFRYALNENTDGYTTPYWDFARWQHEIDILALSGFNAVLIQRGNDLAVYQAFRDIGYTDAAIRNWITQPAHQNWQWMGNMCCFVEPISLSLMRKRAASARKIIDQLRALGITPVLPGFWGVAQPILRSTFQEPMWWFRRNHGTASNVRVGLTRATRNLHGLRRRFIGTKGTFLATQRSMTWRHFRKAASLAMYLLAMVHAPFRRHSTSHIQTLSGS